VRTLFSASVNTVAIVMLAVAAAAISYVSLPAIMHHGRDLHLLIVHRPSLAAATVTLVLGTQLTLQYCYQWRI